ncbi:FecCD family ABC transporter permease [Maledivibacter halophilus]|uniref:Iron complex transport system permease protein n=1 Tax=Maledivibacter halophilus TaxID=36842 RepID=A0A1T5J649_9FIRM|nr:iron ABC transporter permease [Maledivibacter halophilus]SKC46713.1 iron complex transport system permease protein [Maledivibacter halophilus]
MERKSSIIENAKTTKSNKSFVIIFIAILIILISFTIGKYPITIKELFTILHQGIFSLERSLPDVMYSVVLKVRLPRIFAAFAAGASLAASGAAYQGMFRNPLVSPDILGASAGAAFGASLGILMSLGIIGIQILSFLFGLSAVALTYLISMRLSKSNGTTIVLILSGMLIKTLFTAFITLIKYIADPYSKLPEITFWLMGSLASINLQDAYIIFIVFIIGIIPLMLLRWKLNVLSFDEEEARALGLDVKKLRIIVILCSTLMTASVVSVAGLIGWVGLVVPHFSRMLVGPNFKKLLPAAVLVGGSYLLLVDNLARSIGSLEIPLGVLTSIIGAPFFIYLMLNVRKGWI